MDEKTGRLLWACGMRPATFQNGKASWRIVINAPTSQDEALRPINPSRMAIRNAARRLARVRGPAVVRLVMQKFGMRNTIEDVKTDRWSNLYWALQDAARVKSSS